MATVQKDSATYPVQVSGIKPSTTEIQLHDFFSFCGTIKSIDREEKSSTATIHFDKESSAKVALMLNEGSLEGATLTVTSDTVKDDVDHRHAAEGVDSGIDQSDKPRAAIAAEYLAQGYALSDKILERAIEMDRTQGISSKFLSYIQQLDANLGQRAFGPDQKVSATVQAKVDEQIKQAKALDEQKGFSRVAHDYYAKAIASPLGQRVLAFYTSTSKQVHDIHEEARRIAQENKQKSMPQGSQAEGSEAAPNATTQAAPTVV